MKAVRLAAFCVCFCGYACRLELPPPDCVIPDGLRLDCGTLEPNTAVECHDDEPDARVIERDMASRLLCLDGAIETAAVTTPCDLPGPYEARRVRASVGASCSRLPTMNPANVAFQVLLEGSVEVACGGPGGGERGSSGNVNPRWTGQLVLPEARPVLLSAKAIATSTLENCRISVGGRELRPGDGGAPAVLAMGPTRLGFVSLTGPAVVPVAVDCRESTGLVELSCHNHTPEAPHDFAYPRSERLLLEFLLQPGAAVTGDGGP